MYAVTFPIKSLVGSLRAIIPRKFVLPADIESFTNRRRRRSQNIRKNSKYKWELVLLKARGVLDCVAVALSVTQPQTVENALKLFNWRYLTAAFTKNHWTDRTAEINNVLRFSNYLCNTLDETHQTTAVLPYKEIRPPHHQLHYRTQLLKFVFATKIIV